MTDSGPGHTVAGVFHHMYVATGERFHFSETLAELLGMDIANLRALYDRPAPDPDEPDFARRVHAIAAEVGCAPGHRPRSVTIHGPAVEEPHRGRTPRPAGDAPLEASGAPPSP